MASKAVAAAALIGLVLAGAHTSAGHRVAQEVSGAVPASASANVALGRRLAARKYGWTGAQWNCLYALWWRESGWSNTADTATTGLTSPGRPDAFGIAQAYPQNKMPLAAQSPANGGSADPRAQINWGLGDVASVYGNPCNAWSHEQADGWY
jgi:hypothetical protein